MHLLSPFSLNLPLYEHKKRPRMLNFFWKWQNMSEYAGLFRKMPVNASGMDLTHKCRIFPTLVL